jgi:hypothetical protein
MGGQITLKITSKKSRKNESTSEARGKSKIGARPKKR